MQTAVDPSGKSCLSGGNWEKKLNPLAPEIKGGNQLLPAVLEKTRVNKEREFGERKKNHTSNKYS